MKLNALLVCAVTLMGAAVQAKEPASIFPQKPSEFSNRDAKLICYADGAFLTTTAFTAVAASDDTVRIATLNSDAPKPHIHNINGRSLAYSFVQLCETPDVAGLINLKMQMRKLAYRPN